MINPPESYLESLSNSLFPANARERVVCMLTAYFDDSGTHPGSTVVTVAGYIADCQQWVKLEQEWKEALAKAELLDFHMTDFMSRRHHPNGNYGHIDEKRGEVLLKRLITCISLRVRVGIAVHVPVRDYQEAIAETGVEKPDTAYHLCSLACLNTVKSWARTREHQEPMAFMFEDGTKGKGEVLDAWDKAKKFHQMNDAFKDDTISFVPKSRVPLGSADLLAWMAGRRIHQYSFPLIDRMDAHDFLMSKAVHSVLKFDKEMLVAIIQRSQSREREKK